MYFKRDAFILLYIFLIFHVRGQLSAYSDSIFVEDQTDTTYRIPTNYLQATGIILGTNIGVWSFDKFIMKKNYARINLNTIQQNFKTAFVWDNDMFSTNLFAHPYHGGLYFNSARFNGMNFWNSVPFAAGGSLMWEFFMENEPPAINDFITTTIGGACLGEITFRIFNQVIDNRAMGFDRFKREALLLIISPIQELNRMITGEAWKHKSIKGNAFPLTPIRILTTFGYRFMADNTQKKHDVSHLICYDVGLFYGNPYDRNNEKPYDFFSLKLGGNLYSYQPIVSRINALGMLFAKNINLRNPNSQLMMGIFQHFNFYQAKADINKLTLNPYKISEAASIGTGILFKIKVSDQICFSSSLHLSTILLGGSQTDHYKFDNRDYNMGSGFSTKLNLELLLYNKIRIFLNSEDYRIYSWVGYPPNDQKKSNSNVQGDKGDASLSVFSLNLNYIINQHFLLTAETGYYYRKSDYKYYSTIKHRVAESKLSVGYIF